MAAAGYSARCSAGSSWRVIYNGVILIGLGAAGQYIWTAIVLLAAVALDALARRGSNRA